jgi:hypothetical protein
MEEMEDRSVMAIREKYKGVAKAEDRWPHSSLMWWPVTMGQNT